VRDARTVILDLGLAWFDRYADDTVLLNHMLHTEDPGSDGTHFGGRLGSPARDLVSGYLLLALGRRADALERLESSLTRHLEIAKGLVSPRSKWRPSPSDRLARDVALLQLNV
jgi:hypothetical protein